MKSLEERFRGIGDINIDRSLESMTTYRIGGKAKYTVYPYDTLGLTELMRIIQSEKIPYKLLGKGSNLLCSDEDFDGVLIRLDHTLIKNYYEGNQLIAQAGSSIIALAYDSMKKGLSGLEFASGIPGTVGGTIFMNAGAYKSQISDLISEVLVLRDGNLEWISKEECGFGYRSSIFQKRPDWIVVACRMNLTPKPMEEIRTLIENRRDRRMKTQPLDYPSCGSVFRNPSAEKFAWQYIDELGYRGKQVGGAQVSTKHSNFIINVDHAKAQDVADLISMINNDMKKNYGFELEPEVEWFNWPTNK